ncbi:MULTISPECIES: hypothetical protein [Arthrobacter]|uniref:Uncharacterized protein n=2 Tax=Arthrobacter TaxID=1663 RepID=A0ABU9KJ92_9MICC|nr:hypothetical protein [Arthrobacter sp. YJM1]MDP5226785.1 hypothetical protein [Arthrobacter sp. YJM1]
MTSDTTLVLNLTFLGTMIIGGLLASVVLFFACVALAVTGLGRLVYVGGERLVRLVVPGLHRDDDAAEHAPAALVELAAASAARPSTRTAPAVRKAPASDAKPRLVRETPPSREKPKPVMNTGWQQAVREADARALAKATDSGLLPTVAKVSNPSPTADVKAQELLSTQDRPAAKPTAIHAAGEAPRLSLKPGRQDGIARKNMPGLLRPARDDEEQHAKGA